MITQLGKDIFNAQYRILDHRVFVNGEIEKFLTNFETQRNDSEVESLFKVTETVGSLKYEVSDKSINIGASNLNDLSTKLKDLLNEVEKAITVLHTSSEPTEQLKLARIERSQRKVEIDNQIIHSYERLDNSFTIKEEEISELYTDLQLKLNIPK